MTLTKIGVLHLSVRRRIYTKAVDTSVIETNNVELAKVKSDVGDIKSMMNEIMQIVAEKRPSNKNTRE